MKQEKVSFIVAYKAAFRPVKYLKTLSLSEENWENKTRVKQMEVVLGLKICYVKHYLSIKPK